MVKNTPSVATFEELMKFTATKNLNEMITAPNQNNLIFIRMTTFFRLDKKNCVNSSCLSWLSHIKSNAKKNILLTLVYFYKNWKAKFRN